MSEATSLLASSWTILDQQFGVSFTVEGVTGTFKGIAENPMTGIALTIGGMVSAHSITLHFSRDVSFTPAPSGQKYTVNGRTFVSETAMQELGEWVVSLNSENR